MNPLSKLLLAGVAAIAIAGAALAGTFPGYPLATSYTGSETIPMDTNLTGGQTPQTQVMTPKMLRDGLLGTNFRNLLDNPKFDIYPLNTTTAYTGTTVTATLTGVNTTGTYMPARWAVYANAAGASAQISNDTTAANLPAGFQNAYRVQRTSANANTTQICLLQIIPAERVVAMAGNSVALSFYAMAGANFSAATSNLQLTVSTGTTADQGMSTLISAAPTTINSWAGAANPMLNQSQVITTTMTRYTISTPILIASTALEAGLQICFTPVGTAGANDWFEITGVQLELAPTSANINGPSGTVTSFVSPGAFEFRPQLWERLQTQQYAWAVADGAATRHYAVGLSTSTTVTDFAIPLPVTMRTTPTSVVQTAASFASTTGAGTANNCTTFAVIATSNTVNSIGLRCTGAANLTIGMAGKLIGQATGAFFTAVAEF